ncbi:AAA family ATPase [Polycladidibacter stylochi]|uniref:AAA family ATPase n=1 Tax=Polycladidibacter stylochi TaxID=1807766 RepID=UPI00083242D4|nr:AAA family ATPase [Pseudovibrio stylochi]
MRILAVRGQNLASLAAAFEVNLEAEPLKSAGLFAIVGETGAGKSTLLDALCLALYGRCPRLTAEGSDEKVPDVASEVFNEKDARSVLTRGASDGFAQVDFIGVDGKSYRAHWAARRARGKAEGRLQPVERFIERLEDHVVLANKLRDVDSAVETQLGLSYDQFRRTVLLAQGDFDAFLRANDNARAELLEKITGTEVYSEISQRVHLMHQSAQSDVAALQAQCDAVGVLDETARGELIATQSSLQTQSQQGEEALAKLGKALSHLEQVEKARTQLQQAQDAYVQLQQQETQSAQKQQLRAQLQRLKAVQPVHTRQEQLKAQQEKNSAELAQLATQMQQALQECAAGTAQLNDGQKAFETQEQRLPKAQQDWEKAGQLDEALRQCDTQLKSLQLQHERSLNETQKSEAALAQNTEQQSERAALKEKLKGQMARLGNKQELIERASEFQGDMDELAGLDAQRAKAEQEAKARELQQSELEQISAKLRAKLVIMAQDMAGQEQNLAQLRQQSAQLNGVEIERQRTPLIQLGQQVAQLQRERVRSAQVGEELAKNKQQQQQLNAELTQLSVIRQAAEVREAALRAQNRQSASLVALADKAKSEQVGLLRSELEAETPCPVCGSESHPFAEDKGELAALFAGVEAQKQQIASEYDKARQELDEARDGATRTQQHISTLAQGQQKAEQEQASLYKQVQESIPRVQQLSIAGGLQGPKDAAMVFEHPAFLEKLAEDTDVRLGELNSKAQQLEALRGQTDDLEGQLARLRASQQETKSNLEVQQGKQAALREQASAAMARMAANESRQQALLGKLMPAFSPYLNDLAAALTGESAVAGDMVRNGDSALSESVPPALLMDNIARLKEQLQRDCQSYMAAEQGLVALETEVAALVQAAAAFKAQLEASQGQLEQLVRQLEECERQKGDLTNKRRQLLDGQSTQAHREAFMQQLAQLRAQLTQMQSKVEAQRNSATSLQARHAEGGKQLQVLNEQVQAAQQAFEAALQEQGLDLALFTQLQGEGMEHLAALEAELDALAQQLQQGRQLVTTREQDLAGLLALPQPEENYEQLQQLIATQKQAHSELAQQLGSVGEKLRQDDVARAQAAALVSQIEALQQIAKDWGAVNMAVGSANGSKFQRAAQRVTLQLLVQLANKQLRALKPRYCLQAAQNGLGIFVEDNELGGAPRSTRSLSGGERFLVSLSLALALSGMEGRQSFVDTLFIDEGFGTLDGETLDMAIDALEMLQGQGRKVGVISHVAAMRDRIPVQVQVIRQGGGRSQVVVATNSDWQ